MGQASSKKSTKLYDAFVEELPSLEGKTIVITGTTTGTGNIAAHTFVKKGATNVILLNRPSERAKKVQSEIAAEAGNKTNVEHVDCDLQDLDSVRKAVETIQEKYEEIDILCCNAGIMATEDTATKQGYDTQMQTNQLSHFLLVKELYPLLKKAQELRGKAVVAMHSSDLRKSAKKGMDAKYMGKNGGDLGGNDTAMPKGANWARYYQSKLANTCFAVELGEKFGDSGLIATAAAPGVAATGLQKNSGSMTGDEAFIRYLAQSAEDGAMPIIAACVLVKANGEFWDPKWGLFGKATKKKYHKQDLNENNRKIVWEGCEEAVGKFEIA